MQPKCGLTVEFHKEPWVCSCALVDGWNCTSKPQVCLRDPSLTTLQGFQQQMKNRLPTQNGRADLRLLHASVYIVRDGSRISTQCVVSAYFRAISWDRSRCCGETHIQSKSLQESSKSLRADHTTERGENISCTWKSTCSTNRHTWCLVTQLWCAQL